MEKPEPIVSLLIASYNNEKFLDDCFKSLVAQTYKNIELIICDDCSKDNSLEKIHQWRKCFKERFLHFELLVNKENLGITKSINKMLERCQGKYIKLLASDDMLFPEGIEQLVIFAEENAFDLIYSNMIHVNETTKYGKININDFRLQYNEVPFSGYGLTNELIRKCFIAAPGVLIPFKTIEKYGYFDETLSFEDWEYWLRVSITGNIGYVNKITAMYRICTTSASHFGSTKKEELRNQRFCQDELNVFLKYQKYGTKDAKEVCCNRLLTFALRLKNKQQVKKMKYIFKQQKFHMIKENRKRILLFQLGVYRPVQYIARSIRNIKLIKQ